MSPAQIAQWSGRVVLAHVDRRSIPRRAQTGWRRIWYCLDTSLWALRWVGASLAVAVAVLAIIYPSHAALLSLAAF